MEKRVIIDRVEVLNNGFVQLRFIKQIIDGDNVHLSEYHRTILEPDTDIDAQILNVNNHLVSMGWPAITEDDAFNRMKQISDIARPIELVTVHKDMKAAAEAELRAR